MSSHQQWSPTLQCGLQGPSPPPTAAVQPMTAQSVGRDSAVPAQVGTATKASSPAQQIDDTNTTQRLQSEFES